MTLRIALGLMAVLITFFTGKAFLDLVAAAGRADDLQAELAEQIACHEALTRLDRWQISVSCPVEVQTLLAEFDAMEVRAAAAEVQVEAMREDHADAIGRAEARIQRLEERRAHAADIIDTAPRDDGGLVHLDSGRLRQLRDGPGGD